MVVGVWEYGGCDKVSYPKSVKCKIDHWQYRLVGLSIYIAWRLKLPIKGNADENKHFFWHQQFMSSDLCVTPNFKITLCQIFFW